MPYWVICWLLRTNKEMRIGQNPAKSIREVAQPEDVTVAVLSYIPTLGGYYSQSLDILKTCLTSIWENTRIPYDLLVFDNGSCDPVREYLQEAQDSGNIQYLVLSEKNYGKAGAWNFIFGTAPGKYIAYADSDVYHYPGWLEPQIQVLEKFPLTGMVTGMPMWTPEEFSTSTVNWAEQTEEVSLLRGKHLNWEDYWKHSRSLGSTEVKAREHFDTTESLVVTQGEIKLLIGAAHFQFVSPTSVLKELLPLPSRRPMGEVRMLDITLNNAGYLRFCTPNWWVEHLGNRLDHVDSLSGVLTRGNEIQTQSKRFWKRKLPRTFLSWLYHKSFELMYKE
jgi:glycosyltransferase involved in cell wall biosynthesis